MSDVDYRGTLVFVNQHGDGRVMRGGGRCLRSRVLASVTQFLPSSGSIQRALTIELALLLGPAHGCGTVE